MRCLATREIFENMLQLKRFCLDFDRIMNRKWLYCDVEIMISATEMLGASEACSPRTF